jgi:L-alanine-DL-glutamate epimerase-like enolase superfamily enzyme
MQWLELDSYNPDALSFIRRSSSTPIASLETILGRRGLLPFLEANAVDVGIIDALFNGMTESVKMASLLDIFDVNAAAHNTYSPLGSLITAHFCAVIPNFRMMEYDVDEVPWRQSLITRPLNIENGELTLPTVPGWGADVDEEVARAHPAKR